MQANKEFGAKGKKALNDDSIIYCGMHVQRRVREAHLQVRFPPLPLPLPPGDCFAPLPFSNTTLHQ